MRFIWVSTTVPSFTRFAVRTRIVSRISTNCITFLLFTTRVFCLKELGRQPPRPSSRSKRNWSHRTRFMWSMSARKRSYSALLSRFPRDKWLYLRLTVCADFSPQIYSSSGQSISFQFFFFNHFCWRSFDAIPGGLLSPFPRRSGGSGAAFHTLWLVVVWRPLFAQRENKAQPVAAAKNKFPDLKQMTKRNSRSIGYLSSRCWLGLLVPWNERWPLIFGWFLPRFRRDHWANFSWKRARVFLPCIWFWTKKKCNESDFHQVSPAFAAFSAQSKKMANQGKNAPTTKPKKANRSKSEIKIKQNQKKRTTDECAGPCPTGRHKTIAAYPLRRRLVGRRRRR